MTTPAIDEVAVRRFLSIIHEHATRAINGNDRGVLQLCRISPFNEQAVPSRFRIGDLDAMVKTAIGDAAAGHNVYIEARTVRAELRGKKRGTLADTVLVFGLVVDADADKGKAGRIIAEPTLRVETSAGNRHDWFLFDEAIPAAQAKLIGDALRKHVGADADTGVITQCYRVAGTPNFPNKAKRDRGRVAAEPTSIIEYSGRLWNPNELLAAIGSDKADDKTARHDAGDVDEATLPPELRKLIREGVDEPHRSSTFHSVVAQLRKRGWTAASIVALLERYPDGLAAKFKGRLASEVERSYRKHNQAGAAATSPGTLPTIRVTAGQVPRIVVETEKALLAAGAPIFCRAGTLVRPITEQVLAADRRKTLAASLCPFITASLLDWMASAALFQRFNAKRQRWVDIDPPRAIAEALLARKGHWSLPAVTGVITTPTLRHDGSLLGAEGYDSATGLYLTAALALPAMPEPTRKVAEAALELLIDLLSEFSFVSELDRAVALSGLLTALLRGSLPTAPMYLIRAHAPGTGKSYLVDVIAAIATGRLCPVITASKNAEETEKRLGAVILGGSPIVSIDNCIRDLGGELLCQLTERPLVKVRVLGRSEMPECECHTTIFATGNNILLKGDMVRRGLICNLDTLSERPELRKFRHDPLSRVLDGRAAYVAAGLTIVRAYLMAGATQTCPQIGSYGDWSRLTRAPLVWLGQPDPVASMDVARDEDPELNDVRELFTLWLEYLDLNQSYTTSRIIEVACETRPNDFNRQPFKELLMRVAGDDKGISSKRLGWWLRRTSGRVIDGHRLVQGRLDKALANFRLLKV